MHELERARDVRVHAEHAPRKLHLLLVLHELEGNGRAELEHLQLAVARLPYVPVHVHLVVEVLLQLYHERLVRRVLVRLERLHQPLGRSQLLLLLALRQQVLAAEHDRQVLGGQVVLVQDAPVVGLVAEHGVGAAGEGDARLVLHL